MDRMRGLLAVVILASALAAGCGEGGAPSATDTADTTPPALFVSDPFPGAWVTTASYTFAGTTEAAMRAGWIRAIAARR